jgi:hypothetical protein
VAQVSPPLIPPLLCNVGSFCCSVLPVPPVSASVARCGPNRALVRLTSSVRTQLRGNRECLVVVSTCGCDRFYGSIRPGKNIVFQHTSILVRPRQDRRGPSRVGCADDGGAAGYCPRVRCVYVTTSFITIAGRTRHGRYRRLRATAQYAAQAAGGRWPRSSSRISRSRTTSVGSTGTAGCSGALGSARFTARTTRKITNATSRKLTATVRNAP